MSIDQNNPYFKLGGAIANIKALVQIIENMPAPEGAVSKIEYDVALDMARDFLEKENANG